MDGGWCDVWLVAGKVPKMMSDAVASISTDPSCCST
jgi:hypothetical protein